MEKNQHDGVGFIHSSWKKYRILKTVALFSSFMSLGLAASVLGPTIVSMEILLDTDTKSISAAFSGTSFGYLGGAIVCGFIYKHMNKELLFAISTICIAISTALAPFSRHLFMFVGACAVQGFAAAMVDTGGQSYILKLWEGHKHKEPILQGSHSIWSLGATVGPFIIRPFLADLRPPVTEIGNVSIAVTEELDDNLYYTAVTNSTRYGTAHDETYSKVVVDALPTQLPFNSTVGDLTVRIGYTRYAYIIIGSLVLICSILFLVVLFLERPSCADRNDERQAKRKKTKYTSSFRIFRIMLLVIMFLFYFTYLWVEGLPGSFLAAFVIKELNWPNNYGALVISTYWGAHGTGRVLGIPIAACTSALNMLIGDMVLTAAGFAILLFIPLCEQLVWPGVIIAGLGMGTIFASAILWLEGYMQLTGAASSVLLTAASSGYMLGPLLTGYLFDDVSRMSFVYIVFTASLCEIAIFIGAYFFAQKYGIPESHRLNANDDDLQMEIGDVELKPLGNNKNTDQNDHEETGSNNVIEQLDIRSS